MTRRLANLGFALLLAAAASAQAAEISVFSTNAFKTVLEELAPQFERASGHKVDIRFAPTADLKKEIEKGAAPDVVVLTVATTDDLIKQGKLAAASRTELARSGVGVAIRDGTPKPDLSTTDAFKRALQQARSIAYTNTGLTGPSLRKVFERLGIADEMQAKTRLVTGNAAEAVARGEAELGFTQVSEIIHVHGVQLAGPLPQEVQINTVFSAAMAPAPKDANASRALIQFIGTPAAAKVIAQKGMQAVGHKGH